MIFGGSLYGLGVSYAASSSSITSQETNAKQFIVPMTSSWSPFQRVLKLSDLPPSIRPYHLDRILAYPAYLDRLADGSRDPGVSL